MYKAGTVFHSGIRFPRFLTFVLLALFVATSQANGRFQTAAAGCRSTGLHPSEDLSELPHYVPLWLGRSTIVRGQDHCEAACQSCFWMDGYRSSPSWAVFIQKICTGGLRASSASLFHFWLIRLMSFSRWICTFQAARGGLKMSPQCIGHGNGFFIRSFEKFF